MLILGVHAGHDCGAAIIRDGNIIAAENEERIRRNKLAFGVPSKSIVEVIKLAGIKPQDVDEIALESIGSGFTFLLSHGKPWIDKAILTHGQGLLDFFFIRNGKLKYIYGLLAIPLNLLAMTGLPRWCMTDVLSYIYLRSMFPKTTINMVSHHLSHLASAYMTGGMDEALSVVIEEYDGLNAMSIDMVKSGNVIPIAASRYPNSPGVYYSLATRMMGFNQLLHAGKITGLAAYGDEKKAYPHVEKLMWADGMEIKLSPLVYKLIVEYARDKTMPSYFANFSREDIAAAFQRRLEDVVVEIVQKAVKETGAKNIVLSGGVAANVKMNQRIFASSGVKNLFVHPGMSDCGTGLGAALWIAMTKGTAKPSKLKDVFLGHGISDTEIASELDKQGLKYTHEKNMPKKIAELLANKKIVVRVTDKMEYGPRALGHRSILYHCNDYSINKWLNNRLRRTEFMPFAPAVLAEEANRCFVGYEGIEHALEFMTVTCDCTDWMKNNCPAVVHVDKTARPQFVTRESNADFHAILTEYNQITGIPALINTSYNIHDEPIVRSAADALRIFKLTCLDYIAINDYLVSAKENGLVWNK